ncbi:hypothetical protein ACFQY7_28855 [Actinomadura luteofluorescens]|uniref:Uncharacterized protein n=1 Tax=Actinomadura luteofluorescens TaxID=46163 RepID=A0A7Y9JIP8_9ACTN|nr:hypothetical protein [Actinomadura luteofluorescens]
MVPLFVDLVDSAGTGRYFHVAKERLLRARARDGALARRLWDDAEGVLAAMWLRTPCLAPGPGFARRWARCSRILHPPSPDRHRPFRRSSEAIGRR